MSKNIENAMYYSWMSQASYIDLASVGNSSELKSKLENELITMILCINSLIPIGVCRQRCLKTRATRATIPLPFVVRSH